MSATPKRVRVLVVDDSAFMCKVLQGIISSDPQMEVAGQAKDGREAVALAESLRPDVIAMDINMPHMDGLQATEVIMSQNPRPIVVVSSESREGAVSTLRALDLGAVDFVPKPSSGVDLDMENVRDELLRKLKMASKVRVVRTATRSPLAQSAPRPTRSGSAGEMLASGERFPLVVLAASTGGPATVMRLASQYPKDYPAALLAVVHMPASFTTPFCQQLSEKTSLRVKEAESNEAVQPGTLYVCPGSRHLRVSTAGRIQLDASAHPSGYRPCADLAMESVAAYAGPLAIGVVLTGMGNDGARGVRAIHSAGGLVVAQDEATSVIFGMPAEAIKTGAVHHVLPLDEIYRAIDKRVSQLCRASVVSS